MHTRSDPDGRTPNTEPRNSWKSTLRIKIIFTRETENMASSNNSKCLFLLRDAWTAHAVISYHQAFFMMTAEINSSLLADSRQQPRTCLGITYLKSLLRATVLSSKQRLVRLVHVSNAATSCTHVGSTESTCRSQAKCFLCALATVLASSKFAWKKTAHSNQRTGTVQRTKMG